MKGHLQDRDRETLGARDPSLRKSLTLQGLLGTAGAVADTRSTLGRPLEVGKRHQKKVRNGKVPEREIRKKPHRESCPSQKSSTLQCAIEKHQDTEVPYRCGQEAAY